MEVSVYMLIYMYTMYRKEERKKLSEIEIEIEIREIKRDKERWREKDRLRETVQRDEEKKIDWERERERWRERRLSLFESQLCCLYRCPIVFCMFWLISIARLTQAAEHSLVVLLVMVDQRLHIVKLFTIVFIPSFTRLKIWALNTCVCLLLSCRWIAHYISLSLCVCVSLTLSFLTFHFWGGPFFHTHPPTHTLSLAHTYSHTLSLTHSPPISKVRHSVVPNDWRVNHWNYQLA